MLSVVLLVTVATDLARAQLSPSTKSSEQMALQRGQEALRKGDLIAAQKELERAVRLDPREVAAQAVLGWVLAQEGQADAAVPHLRAALKINPGYVEARLTLAGVLAQLGKVAEAEVQARRAVKDAPSNAEAHRILARILSQNSGDQALLEMRQAVALAAEGMVRSITCCIRSR